MTKRPDAGSRGNGQVRARAAPRLRAWRHSLLSRLRRGGTLIGRAYLYGLMAGGRPAVDRAIEILRGQVIHTMRLLQVASLADLTPGHVTQLRRLAPVE